jgi:hypothetical protein
MRRDKRCLKHKEIGCIALYGKTWILPNNAVSKDIPVTNKTGQMITDEEQQMQAFLDQSDLRNNPLSKLGKYIKIDTLSQVEVSKAVKSPESGKSPKNCYKVRILIGF